MRHAANAYDEMAPDRSPRVVLDYVRWPAPGGTGGVLSRLRLDPATGHIGHQRLAEADVEFPRIDDRAMTRPHRFIATTLASGRPPLRPGTPTPWPGSTRRPAGWPRDRPGRWPWASRRSCPARATPTRPAAG